MDSTGMCSLVQYMDCTGMYSLGFLILDRKIFCTHLTSPRSFACSEACA